MPQDATFWDTLSQAYQIGGGGNSSNRKGNSRAYANSVNEQREQQRLQLQVRDAQQKAQMQLDLDNNYDKAQELLYHNNKYVRDYEINRWDTWYKKGSGIEGIQNTIAEFGSYDNAVARGNLLAQVADYQRNVRKQVDKYRKEDKPKIDALARYISDRSANPHLISQRQTDLFNDFTKEDSKLTDYSYFGVRTDYLNDTRTDNVTGESSDIKQFIDMGKPIDLDDIITFWGENTIKSDYMNERLIKEEYAKNINRQELKGWLASTLGFNPVTNTFGDYSTKDSYNGKPVFGIKDNQDTQGLVLLNMQESFDANMKKDHGDGYTLGTVGDFINLKEASDGKVSFSDAINTKIYHQNSPLENELNASVGILRGVEPKKYGNEWYRFGVTKGRQGTGSYRLFTNKNIEDAITHSWTGSIGQNEKGKDIFNYNPGTQKITALSKVNMFDGNGRKMMPGERGEGEDWWPMSDEEYYLNGYHFMPVAKGVIDENGNPIEMVLTESMAKEDLELLKQNKNVKLDYRLVAELKESDVLANDYMYRVIDLDENTLATINELLPNDNVNAVKTEIHNQEQDNAHRVAQNQKLADVKKRMIPYMGENPEEKIEILESNLMGSLISGGVNTRTSQASIPYLIGHLQAKSDQQNYPFVTPDNVNIENKEEYIAFSLQKLKNLIAFDSSQYGESFKNAIKGGPSKLHDFYSNNEDKKTVININKYAKDISKYISSNQ